MDSGKITDESTTKVILLLVSPTLLFCSLFSHWCGYQISFNERIFTPLGCMNFLMKHLLPHLSVTFVRAVLEGRLIPLAGKPHRHTLIKRATSLR